jgi:hypothetical protein
MLIDASLVPGCLQADGGASVAGKKVVAVKHFDSEIACSRIQRAFVSGVDVLKDDFAKCLLDGKVGFCVCCVAGAWVAT